MASTSLSARIWPRPAVMVRGAGPRVKRRIGVFSNMHTPRSSATRRSPRTRKPGWMVAALSSNTPAQRRSVPAMARISSRSTGRAGNSPKGASLASASFQAPTCGLQAAPQIQPTRSNHASMPFSTQNFAIPSMAPRDRRTRRSASASPQIAVRAANLVACRKQHAGIATAWAAATNVALQDNDVEARVALAQSDPFHRPR